MRFPPEVVNTERMRLSPSISIATLSVSAFAVTDIVTASPTLTVVFLGDIAETIGFFIIGIASHFA
jgi:hypothetical protein